MELKMRNLSLRIKCGFSKINSTFFFPALFYSTFISTLLKVALKIFKRMLLVYRFDRFFRFFKRIFQSVSSNWYKNLRAQFGLYRKKAGVWTPWTPSPATCAPAKRYANVFKINNTQQASPCSK